MAKTLVVSDYTDQLSDLHAEVISFQDYLAQYPKVREPQTRVINLCDTQKYLSEGYYCSLLAEARNHKVLPSVRTINDLAFLDVEHPQQISLLKKHYKSVEANTSHQFHVFFGQTEAKQYSKIGAYLFQQFAMPILHVKLTQIDTHFTAHVTSSDVSTLTSLEFDYFYKQLDEFTTQVWRTRGNNKKARWDMAILVNPDEKTPPSDHKALSLFVKAASKVGINAQLVTRKDLKMLSQYDALFIRETTEIKNHTYELACKAEKEGLVVIDDPTSILRCCNKVFLHDAFSYHKVPSPRTRFIHASSDTLIAQLIQEYGFPMVLKLPESAFSLGVYKVNDEPQLRSKLSEMLKTSALVLAQEFLYTEYDWRIGVLNGRVLYACRYYMARNHWQIYNHGNKSEAGDFDTLPTFEVPKPVLDAAINACKFIGNGLYGVDIKQSQNHTYVIEVNDNPSIESDVEDKYLGKALYEQIMQVFVERLEQRGKVLS
jgi:glutathione synthase/RimK-type ligase-like ATP-grasp enzyme